MYCPNIHAKLPESLWLFCTYMQQEELKRKDLLHQVPEFRVSYTITTDKFDALYKQLKPKGVTLTALLAKAAGVALASHPVLYACEPLCTLLCFIALTCVSLPVPCCFCQPLVPI